MYYTFIFPSFKCWRTFHLGKQIKSITSSGMKSSGFELSWMTHQLLSRNFSCLFHKMTTSTSSTGLAESLTEPINAKILKSTWHPAKHLVCVIFLSIFSWPFKIVWSFLACRPYKNRPDLVHRLTCAKPRRGCYLSWVFCISSRFPAFGPLLPYFPLPIHNSIDSWGSGPTVETL